MSLKKEKFQIRIDFEAQNLPLAQDFYRTLLSKDLVNLCVRASEESRTQIILGRISLKDHRDAENPPPIPRSS